MIVENSHQTKKELSVARREVVQVKNAPKHGDNPIPVCTRLGNLILPSVISGRAPDQPEQSADPETQIAQAFTNMKNIIEAAGGKTENIGKVTVYLCDIKYRSLVNKEWVKCSQMKMIARRAMWSTCPCAG